MFNAEFTAVIQTLVAEQGKVALVDPAKCKAFLPDYTKNEYVKDRRLLQRVIEAGVAKEIDTAANLDICKKQQVRHLKEDLFMAEDVAASAVDLLAFVLRGDTGRTVLEVPKPAPQMREASVAAAEAQNLPASEPVPQKPKKTLYIISINSQQFGPFSLEQLKNMIGSGHVSKDYWIRQSDGTDWMPIAALPELKPFFENVPQPAPAVTPKPDESNDAKSKYKHSLGFRILLTSIPILGFIWFMGNAMFFPAFMMSFSAPFLKAIWKKRE